MNRNKFKSLIVCSLIASMSVSLLSGCGTKKSVETKADAAVKSGPSYSWDKTPVTLDWFVNLDWYTRKWDINTLVDKTITDKTGVTINIQTSGAGGGDKLNVMIAADQLPDIITTDLWQAQLNLLQTSGKVEPLLPLIKKEAPTFEALLPKSMINWYTQKDGNWNLLPSNYLGSDQMKSNNTFTVSQAILARKDIMDQLGIKVSDFDTQDGMIAALKKVQAANIQYKGKKVIPFYTGPEAGVNDLFSYILPGMFGMSSESKDGSYADKHFDPKNLEMIKFGNKLYNAGFLTKDNFTAQKNQIDEKVATGSVFCIAGNKSDYATSLGKVFTADPKAEYVSVGPVRANDGSKPQYGANSTGWLATMISKSSKNKTRAIRFLEYLYSDEGTSVANFGVEGKTYTKDGKNDRFKWVDAYKTDIDTNQDAQTKKYNVGTFWLADNYAYRQQHAVAPSTPAEISWAKTDEFDKPFVYDNTAEQNIAPDASSDEGIISGKCFTYYNLQVTKALMASDEVAVEKIYNETLKHMKELGIDSVIKVTNEKFQENKKKLGIKFMNPANK